MAEREPGPYWVRDRFDDDWVVALWNGTAWLLHGDTNEYKDGAFLEVGPRAEMPPLVIDKPPEVVYYDLNTPERKRALMAAFKLPEWPDPQPITDAQKTGERFLVWYDARSADQRGWYAASWDDDPPDSCWVVSAVHTLPGPRITLFIPLPPAVKP